MEERGKQTDYLNNKIKHLRQMEKVKASKQQNSRIKHEKTEDQPANE